jgi:hypothetical protein
MGGLSDVTLSDADAKLILEKSWSERTEIWGHPSWLRAQPNSESGITAPRLEVAGSSAFKIHPDGLYVRLFDAGHCDIIVIEVCGSQQNLGDKRSRYAPSATSLTLACATRWMTGTVNVQKGGKRPRWQAAGLTAEPTQPLRFSVRHLRVLYSLPKKLYVDWQSKVTCQPHEFFCPHSSLKSFKAQKFRRFLGAMSPDIHYYR